jgi:flagellar protein FlaG
MEISSVHNPSPPLAAPEALPAQDAQDRRVLVQAVRAINEAGLYGEDNELSFAFDRATRRAIVRIVDRRTREVVQQIPSEEVLKVAEELQQRG